MARIIAASAVQTKYRFIGMKRLTSARDAGNLRASIETG